MKTLFLFLLLITSLLLPTCVSAQILINEFSSWDNSDDWVELFNMGNSTVDLSKYVIRDSTQTNKINLSGDIQSKSYVTFSFSNRLNRSSDAIRLLKVESSNEVSVDQVPYGGKNQVCAPGSGETVGRVPDGGNVLERFMVSTKNASNNNAKLDPCPVPTETKAPTTTPVTVVLQQNTPTHTPTPLARNTRVVISPAVTMVFKEGITDATGGSVLTEATTSSLVSDTNDHQPKAQLVDQSPTNKIKRYLLPFLLGILGIAFITYSFYLFTKKGEKRL